jgi:hypothetical protein
LTFDDNHVAAVTHVTATASPNTILVDGTEFGGSFADFGVSVTSTTVVDYSATGNIIEYTFADPTLPGGHTTYGGYVEGYDPTDGVYLVDQINGFTPTSNGGYVGTLAPNHFELLSVSTDLSADASNGFNGPNLPLTFQVPEPASATMMAVAVVGFVASRLRQRAARRNKG